MKLNKTIMTAVLGLSLAGLAKADDVYITGSTAAAAAFYSACTNVGQVFQSAPQVTMYGGLGAGVDSQYAFKGTLVGGSGTTYIICNFGGSEGGLQNIASTAVPTVAFMTEAYADLHAGEDTTNSLTGNTVSHAVDLAMADNIQSDSPSAYVHGVYATLTGSPVAVIPFKFVRNKGWWTGSNVTGSMLKQAIGGGALRAVFSGNTSETNDWVYFAGRAISSGTRVNYLGDTTYGIQTAVKQIEIKTDGTLSSSAGLYIRDWGNGAAAIATAFGINTTNIADPISGKTGYSAIACLSYSDAAVAVLAGGTELTYNGVAFNTANIVNGTYTLWGNEMLYYTPNAYSGKSSNVSLVYNNLVTAIPAACDGNIAVNLGLMHATRTGASSDIVHKAN